MELSSILIVGGGIGGLTTAVALRRKGYSVEIVEKDPDWSVYGVGIIQQFNVLRAMASIDLIDAYMSEAYGYDRTRIFSPAGTVADFDAPRLAGEQYPSNAGIKRTALQKILANRAKELGVKIRLGITVDALDDDGTGVNVHFSDAKHGRYDIVIGADGVYSRTRTQIFPDAPVPRYTGQWVWRYNFPKLPDLKGIDFFVGPCNAGLVPIGDDTMYLFLLSQEDEGFKLDQSGAADAMRARATGAPPAISDVVADITEDAEVVGRPLEVLFMNEDWHKGRVVLVGDAVHASTPHLAQGAGMAIEDGIVLAEELANNATPEEAFAAYRTRRFERTKFIAETSINIGDMQMGKIPPFDVGETQGKTMGLMAQPI
ncbi:MAG: 2-polyprenyl-6-methoxyphenol hydroxylase-like FAD-dependent oxidoreductase [Halocynthiibacter sp.]|jgi:2-polyprenyl-6-methoxyphenol hydroxylase-like FAD-dependent oxidoreductase